jgi:multisubunit Na+/H+ antiporter MnhG subunit
VNWRHVVASVLLAGGCSLQLLAVVGLAAMRDAYDRLHYVGLAGYGALLVAVAILVRESFSLIGDKALATGVVVALLSPLLVHTTARSLRVREHGRWEAGIEKHQEGGSS